MADNFDQVVREASNPKWFRQVLGQYPTGVCVVTAMQPNGQPAGMVVGSFTSVSLNPPLVAFLPDRNSSSWPKIQSAGNFCVNVLGADQEDVCRRFASKVENKFEGMSYRLAGSGSPIINDTVAWIDCELQSVEEAGDHFIVIGSVKDLQIESGGLPLLFFQGGYGRFSPLSMVAPDPLGTIGEQLRLVEAARPEMEAVSQKYSARCLATARVDDQLVIAASAGSATRHSASTLVGQRLPFMPPTGAVFAAWNGDAEIDNWLNKTSSPSARSGFRTSLQIVRKRGYSLGLLNEAQRKFASTLNNLAASPGAAKNHDQDLVLRELIHNLDYDPPELTAEVCESVRLISVPVFDPDGNVAFALTLYEFPKPTGAGGVNDYIEALQAVAARVTMRLGGKAPS